MALGQSGAGTYRFDVKVVFPGFKINDRVTNKFRSGAVYRALKEANEDVAINMQKEMVKELERKVKAKGRPQRGSNALEESILHPDNRQVFANTFSVGIEDWMDASPAAAYWRRIEQGDKRIYTLPALFTNSPEGDDDGPVFGPYNPDESYTGTGRKGKSRKTAYVRKQPAGYKHLRMPLIRTGRAPAIRFGDWDKYEFSVGITKYRRTLSMAQRYEKALAPLGLNLQKDFF